MPTGTPIVIKAPSDEAKKAGAAIELFNADTDEKLGDDRASTKYLVQVFGGSPDASCESSSIKMEGGRVASLIGGGYGHSGKSGDVTTANIEVTGGTIANAIVGGGWYYSQVETASVNVTGGTIKNVIGGGLSSVGSSEVPGDAGVKGVYTNPDLANNRVENADVTIDGGETPIEILSQDAGIFGGGQGYSYVGTANLTVRNAKKSDAKCWVVGGGSNGYTGTVNVTIGEGADIQVVQGSNRGTVKNINIEMTDGEVANFYCGGEDNGKPATSSGLPNDKINGLSEKIKVSITGGKITKLAPGINGAIDNNPGADGPAMDEAGMISGEYKRTSVANYKALLTTERYGTALANLLPIEETATVTPPEVKPGATEEEVRTAVKGQVEEAVKKGEVQNGDTVVTATASSTVTGVSDKITALSSAAAALPPAVGIQNKEPSADGSTPIITYLVTNLSDVEANDDGTLKAVTFDITPYDQKVGTSGSAEINSNPGMVTFCLPIPTEWNTPYVKVDHKGTITYHDVKTVESGTDKYIEISASSFSPFVLMPSATKPTPTPTPSPSYSSGTYASEFYVKVIAGANGKSKVEESFYARDEKHTFTMIPDEGYVIDTVTLDDGSVLSHTDTEFVLLVSEPYEVHVTFKKAAGEIMPTTNKPSASKNPQTGDSWFSGLF